jgi:hypothetical protein
LLDPARHAECGRRAAVARPGVVYVAVTTFGFEARDCAKHRTPEGWRVDHSVLIDQLDLPPKQKEPKEEQ